MKKNTTADLKIELYKKGLTQKQIARQCGVSKSFVSMYINGARKSKKIDNVLKKKYNINKNIGFNNKSYSKYLNYLPSASMIIKKIGKSFSIDYKNDRCKSIFTKKLQTKVIKYLKHFESQNKRNSMRDIFKYNDKYLDINISRVSDDEFIICLRDKTNDYFEKEMLYDEIEQLKRFCSNICHDLRSPLNLINGYSEIILDELPDNLIQIKNYFKIVRKNIIKMDKLIKGLTQLSKINNYSIEYSEINLSQIVSEILNNYKISNPATDFNFKIQKNLYCQADASLAEIFLENILSNAVKYSSKNKKIEIEFGQKKFNNKNLYYIKDNGVGFDNSDSENIIKPFKRLQTADLFPGSGIGLATCRKITELHNGNLIFESTPGKGTTVFFSL
ncbi:MAG: ATP-binding protein [Candidatus Muiribacteriota bacterium]